MAMIQIHNPHSVLAAIENRPQAVKEIRIRVQGKTGTAWDQVVAAAEVARIPVVRGELPKSGRRQQRGGGERKSGRQDHALASIEEHSGASLTKIFPNSQSEQPAPGLWIALDCLQDPHNVGAIFRTAAFFGVCGIVMTRDKSAPMSATVYDVAAGGVESVPFAIETNLSRTLDAAKKAGLWVLGTSEHAELDLGKVDRDRPWLLVLGNEEKGMRKLTQSKCDMTCRLTPQGDVTSLNVSVAAGVMISQLTMPGDRFTED